MSFCREFQEETTLESHPWKFLTLFAGGKSPLQDLLLLFWSPYRQQNIALRAH